MCAMNVKTAQEKIFLKFMLRDGRILYVAKLLIYYSYI